MAIQYLFLFLPICCFAQNLVLNPSFEQMRFCPKGIGQFRNNVASWSSPTNGTSDIFATCGKGEAAVPANVFGFQHAQSGTNYAGLYLLLPGDLREYIQGQFALPLEKGTRYTISFYVSLAEHSDYAVNSFAALLTQNQISIPSGTYIKPSEMKAVNPGIHQLIAMPGNDLISDKSTWTKIEASFLSEGGERYFTLGNFKNNASTIKKFVKQETDKTAYYYLDTIVVEQEQEPQPEMTVLEPDKTYTLPVSFTFDSAEITPEAQIVLTHIIDYLNAHPKSRIKLSGHTDDSGGNDYNQAVSLKRAASVAQYLVANGIYSNRITTTGYGEEFPISENATEAGRSRNRRVEFILIE